MLYISQQKNAMLYISQQKNAMLYISQQKNHTTMWGHRKQPWSQTLPPLKPPPRIPQQTKNILLQQNHSIKTRI
jgi:hypothetical protein